MHLSTNENSLLASTNVPDQNTFFNLEEQNVLENQNLLESNSENCSKVPNEFLDFDSEKQLLMENVLTFSLNLHNKNNFTRKDVLQIQESVENLIINPLIIALKKTLTHIDNEKKRSKVNDFFDYIKTPFFKIKSEYRFIKQLESINVYKNLTVFTMSNEVCEIVKNHKPTIDNNSFQGVVMPIKFQIKSFFETSNILQTTIENMNFLKNNQSYCNFINGSVWKKIERNYFNSKQILIPYFLYFDDFEINNPLSSHAGEHKLCGGYYSFPTIPSQYNSQLSTIFLACIFKTKDHQFFGNDITFNTLVKTLKEISEDGIMLYINGEEKLVHFVLGMIIGDNLGLNSILGFTKSFNSNYYCRICKRNKCDMHTDNVEHQEYLRNLENYNGDVLLNDYTLTGIRENCLFNILPTFHVVDNTCVDIMHDIFEGVGKYVLSKVVLGLIGKKVVSIETLNYKKQMFNYGPSAIGNNSLPLDLNLLKNNNIKMTASEMMTFIHFLPLIIGDLVPKNNIDWKVLICLLEIVDIVLDNLINETKLNKLESSVASLNSMFVAVYQTNLKPKFHFLVHYVSTIRKCGPLKGFWCMRYEAKHKEFKAYARSIQSRLNIPYTLSIKACLKFSNLFITKSFISTGVAIGKKCPFNLMNCDYYKNIFFDCEINRQILFEYKSLKYKDKTYKPGYFLAKELFDSIIFFEILSIVVNEADEIFIVCAEASTIFDHHFQAYIVKSIESVVRINQINNFVGPPVLKHRINQNHYIRLKYF